MRCVAVIPARRAEATIADTLASLRLGNTPFVERVVVVTSGDDPTSDLVRLWASRDCRVELALAAKPLSAGAARNLGRRLAGDAELLLFVDADCRLESGGAARLADEKVRRSAAAVSARVLGEGGIVARVRHLLEFKEAASARPAPPAWLPTTTTMLVSASAFDRVGGFADLWPGEDLVFAQALRDAGETVLRSDVVVTRHRHPRGVFEMLRHQRRLGFTAARARLLSPMPGSSFAARPWLAPTLLPARLVRLLRWQAGEGLAPTLWTLALAPLLFAGLLVWTVAFLEGALAGPTVPGRASPS